MSGQHNSQARKSPKNVARPSPEAFGAASSRLDLVNSMARSRRAPAIVYLSTESERSEDEANTVTGRPKPVSYKKIPIKRDRPIIQDSDEEEDCLAIRQTMSASRNRKMARNINRSEVTLGLKQKKTQEDLRLGDEDSESEWNSEDDLADEETDFEDSENDHDDLEIDLKKWNTKSKHHSRTRSTANNAADKALHVQQATPPIRISSMTTRNQASRRFTQSKHTYGNASTSANLLSFRPVYHALQTSSKRQVKVDIPCTFEHRNNYTYTAIHDCEHAAYQGSDIPLPSVKDAYAQEYRVRLRARRQLP